MAKTRINHPLGNGIPPIYGDDWGMVYSCFTHITVDEQEPNPWCLASPEADSQPSP